ncbi:MAG: hypothetical protein CVV56_08530 [Tenericutes bacterium HGW-Tenericutes-1]|jgi:hypothetical protein|nr:MAG: hypothetical protein CVV56_08530 [Tenericutes bacterium HGW-Tenericutes-1]
MKKSIIFLMGVILVFLLVGCDKKTTTLLSNSTTAATTLTSSSIVTSTLPLTTISQTTTATLTTTTESTTTQESTTITSLKTVELSYLSSSSYYGNTNGNASNHGLVAYDKTNKLHYYAVGPHVYSYDPATNESSILFSLSDGGNVRNLCLTETDIYFVSTHDLYMKKYNIEAETITSINEAETYYLSRYNNYIYVNYTHNVYEVMGFGIYRHDNQAFLSNFSSGATLLNVSGTKLLYSTNNGPAIELMADTFMGKTTIKYLSGNSIVEINEMLLIKEGYSSPYPRTFGLIASTSSETALYLYTTDTDALITIATGNSLSGLNTDGVNLYFINGGELYRYIIETNTTEKMMNLLGDSKYLYVINHWIYFSNATFSTLHRINPDTHEIEQLSN